MRGSHVLVSLSVDDAVPNRPALRLFIVFVSAFLFIFQPCATCTFQSTIHLFLIPPFPPPDLRIYYPPMPHPSPQVYPFLIYPKTLRVPIFSLKPNPECSYPNHS